MHVIQTRIAFHLDLCVVFERILFLPIALADSCKLPQWSHWAAIIYHGADALSRSHGTHLHNHTGDRWQSYAGDLSRFHSPEWHSCIPSPILLECQARLEEKASLVIFSKITFIYSGGASFFVQIHKWDLECFWSYISSMIWNSTTDNMLKPPNVESFEKN